MSNTTKLTTITKLTEIEIALTKLKQEHKRLDKRLLDIRNPVLEPFLVKRLKKEKLILKDKIKRLTNQRIPNIIA